MTVQTGTVTLREIAIEVAGGVLETMFFACALPPEEAPAVEDSGYGVVVPFAGARSGRCSVRLGANAARMLAANFLGCDEDELTAEQVEEVVGELGNMVCGGILSTVTDGHPFKLDKPDVRGWPAEAAETPVTEYWPVPFEGGVLEVEITGLN